MQYKKTTATGKLILLGEHSVLQGGGAVAILFGEAACVLEIEWASQPRWQVKCWTPQGIGILTNQVVIDQLRADWDFLTRKTRLRASSWSFQVTFNLPPGSGLGMSASWSVALVRWLKQALDWNEDECLVALGKLENRHHGNASGIDHLTIWHATAQCLEGGKLKPVEINREITQSLRPFFTGQPLESTAEMISQLNEKPLRHLKRTQIGELATMSMVEFASLINDFGRDLETAGAVNSQLSKKFETFRSQGGAVKICGAGGYATGSGVGVAWCADQKVLDDFLNQFCKLGLFFS